MIGVISDTHGLVRPEAIAALQGSEIILHAGDIGKRSVIEELEKIAPVYIVRGNVDTEAWAKEFPETEFVQHQGCNFYILHILRELDIDPQAAGVQVVIYGHSHRPLIETKDDVIFFNPGSAGPRRFSLPVSVGKIRFVDNKPVAEIIELDVS